MASALTGGAFGAIMLNGAASADTSSSSTASAAVAGYDTPAGAPSAGAPANFDPSKGGHMANGITEQLLTGDTAEKVKAAALAAVPGGTIQRVETDAEGAPYEAHMTTADGNHVTVKVDSSFKVTSTEDGHR